MACTFDHNTWRQRKAGICEFLASQGYRVRLYLRKKSCFMNPVLEYKLPARASACNKVQPPVLHEKEIKRKMKFVALNTLT